MRANFVGRVASLATFLLATVAPAWGQNSFAEDIRRPAPAPTAPAPASAPRAGGSDDAQTPAKSEARTPKKTDPRFATAATTEAQEFKVAPTDRLHGDPMHAPTPTKIPGAQVITTEALHAFHQREPGTFLIFDVLGDSKGLPGAQNALPAGRSGSFTDDTQREFVKYLQQVTQGKKDLPLVFYCQSVYCWMSYNAALRAVQLGYTQVFWYRGGIEAWQQAELPTQPRQR
jgi:PQQ-dependent catabolism-associated CXXCW motif protein